MSTQSKLITCKHCGAEIASSAKVCPKCGGKNKKPIYKKWWFWLIVVLLIIGAGSQGKTEGNSNDSVENTPTAVVSSETESTTSSNEIKTEEILEEETTSNESNEKENAEHSDSSITSEDNTKSETDSIPTEYKSALKKAESYSELMHMSKAGIYDQLVSEYGEQFSTEAAQYAIDNIVADWNANALAKAEDYQELMNMSPAAIYDQLVSEYGEKFTAEEAQYAIDHLS